MANLTTQVASMLLMHQDVVLPCGYGDVTRFAAWVLDAIITMVGRYWHVGFWPFVTRLTIVGLTMHFVPGVAIDTGHASLTEVNVGHEAFVLAQVFIANAAAVTGGAIACHRRCFVKVVSVDEAATNQIGLADVTFTARCMAGTTMVAEHAFQFWVVGWGAACIEHCPVSFQIGMQVVLIQFDNIGVAIATGLFRVVAGIRN